MKSKLFAVTLVMGCFVDNGQPDEFTASNLTSVTLTGTDGQDKTTSSGTSSNSTTTEGNPTTSSTTKTSENGGSSETTLDVSSTSGMTEASSGGFSSSTGPGMKSEETPYNACGGNEDCEGQAICIYGGESRWLLGNFCSPPCQGEEKSCPPPAAGVETQGGAACLLDAPGLPGPSYCAVTCIVGKDACGPFSECEDIGSEPINGVTKGLCTNPA